VVEAVAIRPMCCVAPASADSSVKGLDRHVEDREVIRHEEGIEPAPLQSLGKSFQVAEIEVGVRVGAGIAPRAGMDADRPHERAEAQLT
jgi:hypothetical protein